MTFIEIATTTTVLLGIIALCCRPVRIILKLHWYHQFYEVGAPVEKRVEIAEKMLAIARCLSDSENSPRAFHMAFDVLYHEGHFDRLEPETELHQRFWTIGHEIVKEIMKRQDRLNVEAIWFAPDYDSALALNQRC